MKEKTRMSLLHNFTALDLWPDKMRNAFDESRAFGPSREVDLASMTKAKVSFQSDPEFALYLAAGYGRRWSFSVESMSSKNPGREKTKEALEVVAAVEFIKPLKAYNNFTTQLDDLKALLAGLHSRDPFVLAKLHDLEWDPLYKFIKEQAAGLENDPGFAKAVEVTESLNRLITVGRHVALSTVFSFAATDKGYDLASLVLTAPKTLLTLAKTLIDTTSAIGGTTKTPAVLADEFLKRYFPQAQVTGQAEVELIQNLWNYLAKSVADPTPDTERTLHEILDMIRQTW